MRVPALETLRFSFLVQFTFQSFTEVQLEWLEYVFRFEIEQFFEARIMSADAVVLDYYDCLLRSSDLMLLNESQWINDNLIGFAFEYVC